MPGLFYSPDRVWQVIAYLRSLSPREKAAGDPARGAALFQEKACVGCHRVGGKGGRTGPDLTHIGSSRALGHLREALTNPDADVRQRYWLVTATGPGGKPVSGFLLNEDTYTVQFIDEEGKLASLDKAGLRNYQVAKKSKMPGFSDLPGSQIDDLVAYLASLRRPGGSRP
jgi:putative heme-binding domain-containing protein